MREGTLFQRLNEHVQAGLLTSDLSTLLIDIASAAIKVSSIVNRNSLNRLNLDIQTINTHGEKQHRLDMLAQDIFLDFLKKGKTCKYVISEECEDTIELFKEDVTESIYTVCLDPLDGSSNIDINISVGSIFSIYSQEKSLKGELCSINSGSEQLAGGYIFMVHQLCWY